MEDFPDVHKNIQNFIFNDREYTVFSGTHGTFTEINHVRGHKANLKYHRNKIIYISSPDRKQN